MEERIGHMAGAQSAEALTPDELQGLIRAAGRQPVERDTFFRPVVRSTKSPSIPLYERGKIFK
jgi:aminodeoxyfutalosine synthase